MANYRSKKIEMSKKNSMGVLCNQCGDKFFKKEMRFMDKVDGPYCKYCVNEWKKFGKSNNS